MSAWFTFPMLVAFLLGVLMSAAVKGLVSSARSKIG